MNQVKAEERRLAAKSHQPPAAKSRRPPGGGRRRRRLAAAVLLASLLAGGGWFVASAMPGDEAAGRTAVDTPDVGFEQKLNAAVPTDLALVDERGRRVLFSDLLTDGKPVILNLVYYRCPMLCNMSMDGLVRTLNTMRLRVGADFHVVMVSFDPRETPELAAAAKRHLTGRYGGSPDGQGWHFLTGDAAAVSALTEAVGFRYEYDEQTAQFAHGAGVVILTPEGRVSRYINGVDYAARDLRLSLVEASAAKIGTVSDQALLLCYRYDPLTGRYGLAISRAIRVAGLWTVVMVVGGIAWAVRRERVVREQAGVSAGAPLGGETATQGEGRPAV